MQYNSPQEISFIVASAKERKEMTLITPNMVQKNHLMKSLFAHVKVTKFTGDTTTPVKNRLSRSPEADSFWRKNLSIDKKQNLMEREILLKQERIDIEKALNQIEAPKGIEGLSGERIKEAQVEVIMELIDSPGRAKFAKILIEQKGEKGERIFDHSSIGTLLRVANTPEKAQLGINIVSVHNLDDYSNYSSAQDILRLVKTPAQKQFVEKLLNARCNDDSPMFDLLDIKRELSSCQYTPGHEKSAPELINNKSKRLDELSELNEKRVQEEQARAKEQKRKERFSSSSDYTSSSSSRWTKEDQMEMDSDRAFWRNVYEEMSPEYQAEKRRQEM